VETQTRARAIPVSSARAQRDLRPKGADKARERLRKARDSLTVSISGARKYRALVAQDVRVQFGRSNDAAVVLRYEPVSDLSPYATWEEFGLLDTLELLYPGGSHGERSVALTLKDLGYAGQPLECLVLQAPYVEGRQDA
jgi:hypothetical protein